MCVRVLQTGLVRKYIGRIKRSIKSLQDVVLLPPTVQLDDDKDEDKDDEGEDEDEDDHEGEILTPRTLDFQCTVTGVHYTAHVYSTDRIMRGATLHQDVVRAARRTRFTPLQRRRDVRICTARSTRLTLRVPRFGSMYLNSIAYITFCMRKTVFQIPSVSSIVEVTIRTFTNGVRCTGTRGGNYHASDVTSR